LIGFKSKSPFSIIGLVFIFFALFVGMPVVVLMQKFLRAPYEKYDYNEIVRHGERKNARITRVKTNYNSTYNGINPRIISYEYSSGDSIGTDKFQTIELDEIESLQKKDSIAVFVWNGKSVIATIEPYTFPVEIFWMLPILFLLIGIPMFCIAHFAGMRNVRNSI
jgi:hypothetical protein